MRPSMTAEVVSDHGVHKAAGTIFGQHMPRLVALDDLLVERLRACTNCGQRKPLTWANVVELPGLLPAVVVLCQPCYRDPQTVDALGRLLIERYTNTLPAQGQILEARYGSTYS